MPWSDLMNKPIGQNDLEAGLCPGKPNRAPGDLVYVINAGVASMEIIRDYDRADRSGSLPPVQSMHSHNNVPIDWNQNGELLDRQDSRITRGTGVSWVQVRDKNYSLSIDKMYDGTSHTILFGENYRTGFARTRIALQHNWTNPSIINCAFVFPVDTEATNATNYADPPQGNGPSGLPNVDDAEVQPFLSSSHPGGVTVAMVDGSVKTLANGIDRVVYKSHMTPNGKRGGVSGFQIEPHISE